MLLIAEHLREGWIMSSLDQLGFHIEEPKISRQVVDTADNREHTGVSTPILRISDPNSHGAALFSPSLVP